MNGSRRCWLAFAVLLASCGGAAPAESAEPTATEALPQARVPIQHRIPVRAPRPVPAAAPDNRDRDGDGNPDVRDLCPEDPEDLDGFMDEDGCPDADNDLDRIPDVEDQCPNEPERYNGYRDEDGCPES